MSRQTLAIHGGEAIFPEGPPGWPPHDHQVLAAMQAAFEDGSWGRYDGVHGRRLSERLCELHQTEHTLLCASGTIAVELALRGLRVGEGDEVVLAAYDFGGNFRAVEAVGARPVLVDLADGRWVPSTQQFSAAISPRTKVLLVSHLHGCLASMSAIATMAHDRGVAVLEDACQVPGASLNGRLAGSGGDVGVHSFGGSKLLTAGRGGAVMTQRDDVAQRIKVYCERGNHAFPLSELQAAVLLPQIEQLAARNQSRDRAVRRLRVALQDVSQLEPAIRDSDQDADRSAYYKLPWRLAAGVDRESFVRAVRGEGVALDAGFRGFTQRSRRRCDRIGELENARAAVERTVILHHPILLAPDADIDRTATALRKVSQATL